MKFEDCNIPLIRLRGVKDSYPPQKKSFLMLRHMAVHFSRKYKWFLRADDDIFVNFNTIHALLQSIYTPINGDSYNQKLYYVGQVIYINIFVLFFPVKYFIFYLYRLL